jgi:ABC-2 type transport system ATP-binding protein
VYRFDGMAVGQPILEAFALAKRYSRGVWALKDVDLEVPGGSITALVGPNGAGKSTLIKAWVAFERPTAGRVAVAGIDPWRERSAALAHIGYVPQSPALYRELNVEEHVALAAGLRPGFDDSYARRRLEELGIPLRARTAELSGGQQAQVGLALALGTRADVLLLDEPLASLDPLARREFLHVVTDSVRTDGTTALLSSHIITDVEQACDRLVVLGGGRKLLDDSIQRAIARHRIGVVDPSRTDVTSVSSFPGEAGQLLTLVRSDAPPTSWLRTATLDEIVMGYLASGRRPASSSDRAA